MSTKRHRKSRKGKAWAIVWKALERSIGLDPAVPAADPFSLDVIGAYAQAKKEMLSTEAIVAVAQLVKTVYAAGFVQGKAVGKAEAAFTALPKPPPPPLTLPPF